MADLEQTANPSPEATSTEPVPFWERLDEEAATENPEPIAEPEAPEEPAAAVDAESEPEVEEDANWLPDEQQKVFPDDVLAKYAKRYGMTLEAVQANPSLKHILQDKINSDIFIQQQKAAAEEPEEAEEPTPSESEPVAQPTDRAAWLEQVATQGVDQKTVEQFGREFLTAAGVDPKDPNNAAVLQNAGAIGKVLTKGAIDLYSTVGQQMQAQMLETAFPGLTEMYQRSLYQLSWERAASGMKDANLPKYGTPEFASALKEAAQRFPGFESMVFTGKNGEPLPPHQQIQEQYAFLARQMSGQKATPVEVKQALETGKAQAAKADRNRAAGKVLGAGQGNKQFSPAKPADEFRSWIQEYNDSQRSTPNKD